MNEAVPPPLPPTVPRPRGENSFMYAGIAIGIASVVAVGVAMWAGFTWLNKQIPGAETVARYPELRRADPDRICETAFGLCSSGRQDAAEALLDAFTIRRREAPQLLFMRGVLVRSRFSKESAAWYLERMLQFDSRSARAEAARLVMDLDRHRRTEENFQSLKKLTGENPKDALIHWLLAIECRELERGDDGETAYRELAARFEKGPVMFHQTFANVLMDYQKKYEEALEHYRIAVAMEPRSWSFHAMGVCLEKLKRYDEAEKAMGAAVTNSPDSSKYWDAWATCLARMGRPAEALAKYEEAVGANPDDGMAWSNWGWALERMGREEESFEKYRRAAELEEPLGMSNLANCYLNGWGCETNHGLARTWAERAYKAGRREACHHLGRIHADGLGVPRDNAKAVKYFEEGASRGDRASMTRLARHYAEGLGVKRDGQRSLALHERASQLGDDWAALKLAQQLSTGWGGVARDVPRAMRLLEELHTRSYRKTDTAAYLGYNHATGRGIPTNFVLAVRYYEEALPGGEKWVMNNLGDLYARGLGTTQNCARAAQLFAKAGDADSLNRAAWMLATSTNSTVWNGPLAVEYALKAVAKNSNDVTRLDTLAAAHARAGNFAEAVAVESRVVAMIEKDRRPAEMQWLEKARARVELYRNGKACVEPGDS